ncbi:hypothetical protein HY212_06595 [Candidatus Pacearchaeota archaeon]|nr:hypothetical protein [Candidatus Pacearchaeota archaeon]
MKYKKEALYFLILAILVIFFFKFQDLGLSIVNTTSNVTVGIVNSYPYFGFVNSTLFVCEENRLYYPFFAYDNDGNALTGDISPRDPFFLFWISQTSQNNNTFAVVSGTISKAHAGGVNAGSKLYQETISINDGFNATCCTNSTNTNITAIEINHAPVIEDVGVKTIWSHGDNSTLYEKYDVNDTEYDLGYGNLTFNISIVNATTGTSVNLFNISSSGVINFTANLNTTLGVYNITVCVNDTGLSNPHPNINTYCGQTGGSRTSCDNFSLTITNSNRAPNITSYYPRNLTINTPDTNNLYFNITTADPDGTIPDAYWFVDGVQAEYDSGNPLDEFSHTFGCGVSGVHNVSVNVTDGLLYTSLTWNITLQIVSCFNGGGGVNGGGGGGATISQVNFNVTPEFLTATIFKEEGKSFDIKIKNTGSVLANITAEAQNLTEMAILNEDNFQLKVGEEKTVRLYLYALKSAKPGVYFGKISFKSGTVERKVNIVLEVKERESLFDIKISVPNRYKSVYAGQDIKALVDMLNVGLYGANVDVELYLYITNFDKFIIYESSKEVIAVKTNVSTERILHVPLGTQKGPYIVLGEARYGNITVASYDTFNVVEKKYLKASYVLIIIAILIIIFLILFILWKRRKKRKEEENK